MPGERFLYSYAREGRVGAAVCYPNTYRAGMSNLGFHRLFHTVASRPGMRAARFFFDRGRAWSPDLPETATTGMDLLFFSLSFELDYLNLLSMLDQGGLSPLREERARAGRSRLVVAGGIAVTANPLFLSPFADIICRGDMEMTLPVLLDLLAGAPFADRQALLREASSLPGVFVPEVVEEPPGPAYLEALTEPAHSIAVTARTEFSRMFLVEIARGCRGSCLFCMTRCAAPFRLAPVDRVVELAGGARSASRKIGLIAPVVTDHPDLPALVQSVNRLGMTASFSSLRADRFTPSIARLVRENGQKTVTFAPETGSVELRRSLGKSLTDQALLASLALAQEHGVRRLRWYFMYGLPGERGEDLESIGRLVREAAVLLGRGAALSLSVNPFVPKNMTPLQDFPLYPMDYYREARARLQELLAGLPGVTARFESLRTLELHYYLSRGNGETGRLLLRFLREGDLRGFPRAAAALQKKQDRTWGGEDHHGA